MIIDMPKLESPFVRKMNDNGEYVVTEEIIKGYEWVFDDPDTLCMEKLDGTNVSIDIKENTVLAIYNRTERIPIINKGKRFITEGILESYSRGYMNNLVDGQNFGELIGVKLAKNPYQINGHIWIPFSTFGMKHLVYNSYHKYPKTFENIKNWLLNPIEEGGIFSLFMKMKGIDMKPEGVVFYNLKTGQMAKLRLDMYAEYKGRRHKEEV